MQDMPLMQECTSRPDRQVQRGSHAGEPVLTTAFHSVRINQAQRLHSQCMHLDHTQHRLPRQGMGSSAWLPGRVDQSPST